MNHPVRAERERQRLTIEALAAAAGVNERSVRRAESWEPVSAETRERLAGALGVETAALYPPVAVGSVIEGRDGPARIAGVLSGNYIIAPLAFGPVEEITEADLRSRFAVDTVAPSTRPERHGYEALAAASRRNAIEIEHHQQRAAADQARVANAEEAGWITIAAALEDVR